MTGLARFGWILAPLGWLYAGVMGLRRRLYGKGILKSFQLPGLVISVGNLEAGGTGKSPVVIAVAEALRAQGAHPAILTRGYRSGLTPKESAVLLGGQSLLNPQLTQDFHADEARMQAERLGNVPVIIGSNRIAAALRYLESHRAPTHWILDDGFQHLKLKRQLDIVLLDALRPFAEGRCLPAGRLRERPSTLKFAHLVLLTRAPNHKLSKSLTPMIERYHIPVSTVVFTNGRPQHKAGPAKDWSEVTTCLLALGIAQPQRVIEYAIEQRFPVKEQLLTGDHEMFPKESLQRLATGVDAVLTTEKDFWRQTASLLDLQKPVFVLPLVLTFPEASCLSKFLSDFTRA